MAFGNLDVAQRRDAVMNKIPTRTFCFRYALVFYEGLHYLQMFFFFFFCFFGSRGDQMLAG